jgi:hypothetical protein
MGCSNTVVKKIFFNVSKEQKSKTAEEFNRRVDGTAFSLYS